MNQSIIGKIQNEPQTHMEYIAEIEEATKRALVCHVANLGHPGGTMKPEDDKGLDIILQSTDLSRFEGKLDFLISSNGGQPEVADKMVQTLRAYSTNLRVIVPKSAMSAATLLAFGADRLMLGETSELGPFDPQMIMRTPKGESATPASSIIDAWDRLRNDLRACHPQSPDVAGLLAHINQINPLVVQASIRATSFSKQLAGDLLKNGLLKGKSRTVIDDAVKEFVKRGQQLSHGMSVRYPLLQSWGFDTLDIVPRNSDLWKKIFHLFLRLEIYVVNRGFAKHFANNSQFLSQQITTRTI